MSDLAIRVWASLRVFLWAILLGPPIGGFVFGFLFVLIGIFKSLTDIELLGSTNAPEFSSMIFLVFVAPLFFALFSYFIGFFPACVCGFLCMLVVFQKGHLSLVACLLSVFFGNIGYIAFLMSSGEWAFSGEVVFLGLLFLTCSFASAFIIMRRFIEVRDWQLLYKR